MATFSPFSLLALFLLSLLFATSSARPCKTLFYFSTTTLNSIPSNPNDFPNFPNSNPFNQIHRPRYFSLIFINPNLNTDQQTQSSSIPNFRINTDASSVKDRTMDIMSVAGALLFGVGCGALTASIMYFIWAIFSSNRDVDFDVVAVASDDEDEDFDDEAAAAAAKKKGFGYVKVDGDEEIKKTDVVV